MYHLIVAALAVVSAAASALLSRLARKRIVGWRKVARELGLSLSEDLSSGLELYGQLGDCWVRVSEFRSEGESRSLRTEFQVDCKGIPGQVSLSRERIFSWGQDIQIGDDEFDREICVQGSELKAFALLNAATRPRVRAALAKLDLTVQRGEIRYTVNGWIKEYAPLRFILLNLVKLARCLVLPWGAVPQRLSENSASTDLLPVRLRNLELLQEHFGGTELAREASLKALEDRRGEMRLTGAMYLDDLESVAKIAGVESTELPLRVRAVRHLAATADSERAGPLLERLLSARAPGVLSAAAEAIGSLQYPPAVSGLVALLARADPETATVVATALGRIGDASAEPALLGLLDRDDAVLKTAAARALGSVGTVAAVEPLLDCTQGFLDSELKRVAREAVGSIQARLGDVEAGRLSVAEPLESEGALSLSSGEAGGLSRVEPVQNEKNERPQ